jgi:hypothetical protein
MIFSRSDFRFKKLFEISRNACNVSVRSGFPVRGRLADAAGAKRAAR